MIDCSHYNAIPEQRSGSMESSCSYLESVFSTSLSVLGQIFFFPPFSLPSRLLPFSFPHLSLFYSPSLSASLHPSFSLCLLLPLSLFLALPWSTSLSPSLSPALALTLSLCFMLLLFFPPPPLLYTFYFLR